MPEPGFIGYVGFPPGVTIQPVKIVGELNVTKDQIRANVSANLSHGWQQVTPHLTTEVEVMVLAGGPSLNSQTDTIRRLREEGVKLVTLNGTYKWALYHDLKPSAQIVVDGREFNARFTKPVIEDCKYLISSQCAPPVLNGLPHERTWLWHSGVDHIRDLLDAHGAPWWPIPGGSTVMLRAIPLLRMLGFHRFHLFGFDSCLDGESHHAYEQPENDNKLIVQTTCGDRTFQCHAWMVNQAREFQDLVRYLGDEIDIEVYGDGLIAHVLRTAAELDTAGEQ